MAYMSTSQPIISKLKICGSHVQHKTSYPTLCFMSFLSQLLSWNGSLFNLLITLEAHQWHRQTSQSSPPSFKALFCKLPIGHSNKEKWYRLIFMLISWRYACNRFILMNWYIWFLMLTNTVTVVGNTEPKKWRKLVSTSLAAAVIAFTAANLPAMADLNKFEAETRGEFGIGSAAQFGSADLKSVSAILF